MIHPKEVGQVEQTILHYKILEKLGEGGLVRRSQTNIRGSSDGQ
jgi:hypothetical protein